MIIEPRKYRSQTYRTQTIKINPLTYTNRDRQLKVHMNTHVLLWIEFKSDSCLIKTRSQLLVEIKGLKFCEKLIFILNHCRESF